MHTLIYTISSPPLPGLAHWTYIRSALESRVGWTPARNNTPMNEQAPEVKPYKSWTTWKWLQNTSLYIDSDNGPQGSQGLGKINSLTVPDNFKAYSGILQSFLQQ